MKKKKILSWILAVSLVISSLPLSALAPDTVLANDSSVTVKACGSSETCTSTTYTTVYGDFEIYILPSGTTQVEVTRNSEGYPAAIINYDSDYGISASDYHDGWWDRWQGSSYSTNENTFTLTLSDLDKVYAYGTDIGLSDDADYYYAYFMDSSNNTYNVIFKINKNDVLSLSSQPQNAIIDAGEIASFTVTVAGGTEPYNYQWQQSTDSGANWTDITGATDAAYNIANTTVDMSGTQVRCKVTDGASPVATLISGVAALTVNANIPFSVTLTDGTNVPVTDTNLNLWGYLDIYTISIPAGITNIRITEKDAFPYVVYNHNDNAMAISSGGNSVVTGNDFSIWTNASYASDVYTLPVSELGIDQSMLNNATLAAHLSNTATNFYFCDLFDSAFTSALLVVQTEPGPLNISAQPQNVTVDAGEITSFTVTAAGGTEPYNYQWQSSTDSGGNWSDITDASSDTYTTGSATTEMDGTQYRCIVTDSAAESASVTSDAATLTVNAASATAWDGTIDTSWYNTTDTKFAINTPAQLAGLASIVNGDASVLNNADYLDANENQITAADTFEGKVITLAKDIDLNNQLWTPISKSTTNLFGGTFNGGGYQIKNININATANYAGLFGYSTGIIQNVIIASGTVQSSSSTLGSIAGNNTGTVIRCTNYADVINTKTRGSCATGGIVGVTSGGTVSYCVNYGTITVNQGGLYVGGIIGQLSTSSTIIENCYNRGDVNGKGAGVGGIAGYINVDGCTIQNCYNTGNVTADSYVGGIYGKNYNKTVTISNNYFLKTDTINSTLEGEDGITAVDETGLKSAETLAALGSAYQEDNDNTNDGYPVFADAEAADKTVLETAIAAVTGDDASNYYQSGDHYNGSDTSENGFWSDMQTVLGNAQLVDANEYATQAQVDYAAAALEAAIAKLIPATQANATALYEAVHAAQGKTESDYTAESWAAFSTAQTEAETLLDSLFDVNGEATNVNTASMQSEVDEKAAALSDAKDVLIRTSLYESAKSTFDLYREYIGILLEHYDYADLDSTQYTQDSWNTYVATYDAAKTFYEKNTTFSPSPANESEMFTLQNNCMSAFRSLYVNYFWTLVPNDSITVALTFIDNASVRNSSNPNATSGYTSEVILSSGFTVADAMNAAGLSANFSVHGPLVYVNGIYIGIYEDFVSDASSYGLNAFKYRSNVLLKDGDEVVVVMGNTPLSNMSPVVATTSAYPSQFLDDIIISQFTDSDELITVEEGETFTLTVESQSASLFTDDSAWSAAKGMTLFASAASDTADTAQPTITNLGVITDENGQAEVSLAGSGYYVIGTYDLRDDVLGNYNQDGTLTDGTYYSMNTGALIRVYVTPMSAEKLAENKTSYIGQLTAHYEALDFSIFTEDELASVNDYYNTGLADIENATAYLDARTAYNTAVNGIDSIVKSSQEATETALSTFRTLMKKLPDDTSKLNTSLNDIIQQTISTYDSMSDYQKSLLTGVELNKYDAIVAAYNAGLSSEKVSYGLSVNIESDSDEATAALNDMIAYLQTNNTNKQKTTSEDSSKDIEDLQDNADSYKLNEFYNYNSGDYENYDVSKALPNSTVILPYDYGYYAYLLVREDEDHAFSGNGWTISNEDFLLSDYQVSGIYYYYNVLQDMTVEINGVKYEIKDITYDGIDESDVTLSKLSLLDRTDFNGKDPDNVNVYFNDAQARFTMPFNDVTITIEWGPVDDSGETLSEAQADAKATLNAVYVSYNSSNYETEDWESLLAAKNAGLTAIDAAATIAAVATAKQDALNAMAAVPEKNSVTVIVRNDTYADGAFTGEIINTTVVLESDDTMMTLLLKALAAEGYNWAGTGGISASGYDITYLSSITKDGKTLAEFSSGGGSGWMGGINDWFVNEGFNMFSVADGKLKAGDVISVEYTCNLGEDIGAGVEGDTDTSLCDLSITSGTLSPVFDGKTTSYLLTLDDNTYASTITFSATKSSFQARAYLNSYDVTSDSWYSSGDTIPIAVGDVIYIGVGNSNWPSMGSGTQTVYTIAVVDGPGAVETYIDNLPSAGKLTIDDQSDVTNAKAMFDALSAEDKAQIGETLQTKLAACVARMNELEAIENVTALIEALPDAGDLVYADKPAVTAAQNAYDALGETLQLELQIRYINKLDACVVRMEEIAGAMEGLTYEAYTATGNWLSSHVTNPTVNSTGGEWAVIGLARSGYAVPDGYYDIYLSNLATELTNNGGVLSTNKYTEYSRAILAVTVVGGDVTDVAGYNLLTPLADFDKIKYQGINGPIWALIAFDSHDYEIPTVSGVTTQTTRDMLIHYILAAQLNDGGWSLSYTGDSGDSNASADPDVTSMAIQSLAPYYNTDSAVKTAVDKALATLSGMQSDDGTFGSAFGGGQSSESTAQVIVALTALGIDPTTDARFIKNSNDAIDALMLFSVNGGGFKHILSGSLDGMATEQSYYALTAYYRLMNNQTSLYDMSDVSAVDNQQKANRVINFINDIGTPITLESETKINTAITAYNALTTAQKKLVTNYGTLQSAVDTLSNLKVAHCEELINAIGNVTLDSESAITAARAYYSSLTKSEQGNVNNYAALTAAENTLQALKDAQTSTGTKSVTVKIGNVTYEVSENTKKAVDSISNLFTPADSNNALPDDFINLTGAQVNSILDAYKAYAALSDDEKLFVKNYKDFETVLNKLGDVFHQDKDSGVDVRGNDAIPWNIKVNAAPQTVSDDELAKIRETLGKDANMMVLCDINFTDMLNGTEYHPSQPVTVKIPLKDTNYTSYKTLVIVHIKDDGTYEYLQGKIENGYIVFTASDFSKYAVAGSMGTWNDILSQDKNSSLTWLWIILIAVGVVGFGSMLVIKKKRDSMAKEE